MSKMTFFGLCWVLLPWTQLSAQMTIAPSDETFRAALEQLKPNEQAMVTRGFSFRLETSGATYAEPIDERYKTSKTNLFSIEHDEYAKYFNQHLSKGAVPVVKLRRCDVFTSLQHDTGTETPSFFVVWELVGATEQAIRVRGWGVGSTFSDWKVWNMTTNPISIRSANLAFFAAYLRAAIKVEEQITSAAP